MNPKGTLTKLSVWARKCSINLCRGALISVTWDTKISTKSYIQCSQISVDWTYTHIVCTALLSLITSLYNNIRVLQNLSYALPQNPLRLHHLFFHDCIWGMFRHSGRTQTHFDSCSTSGVLLLIKIAAIFVACRMNGANSVWDTLH